MKLSMIYMASGFGSRFGGNKLLTPLEGKPLYRHGLEQLLAAAFSLEKENSIAWELLLITQYPEILEETAELPVIGILNPFCGEGIAASLRLGTERASVDSDAFLYFVADQPFLCADTLTALVRGFFRVRQEGPLGRQRKIACVSQGGQPGNPAVFDRSLREELMRLHGDRGGGRIIRDHPGEVWMLETPPEQLRDIDRPEDLMRGKQL